MIKRFFDVILASAGLVGLSPLFLAVAVAVRVDGSGPVLFRQVRVGLGGRPFVILKFRTMWTDGDGVQRVTRWGRLLRGSKVDELPQLLNVLAGQMSLVGPRPELAEYVALWGEQDRALILSVRPGLTDPASIAYRHEERLLKAQADAESYYRRVIIPRKLRLCRFYVRRAGVVLDLWLILQTIAVLAGLPTRMARLSARMCLGGRSAAP